MLGRYDIYERTVNFMERERVSRGMTQEDMATYLDLSLSGYKRIINMGSTKIDFYIVYKLAKLTEKFVFEIIEDKVKGDFCKEFRSLDNNQLDFIKGIVDIEKELSGKQDEQCTLPLIIPTGNMIDGMKCDSMNSETITVPCCQATCAIKITSNHLHPVYHEGDVLLVRQEPPRDGDTGIFINKNTGNIYIRKFRQGEPCRLEPICGYGSVITVDPHNDEDMNQWIKFGYVITKLRR